MTKEELLKKISQTGFELVESTDKCETYKLGEITICIYDTELETKWYVGDIQHKRVSICRSMTWKNKRYSSRAYQWDELKKFLRDIDKQKKNEVKHKPINDKSVRSGELLLDEAKGSLHRQDAPNNTK